MAAAIVAAIKAAWGAVAKCFCSSSEKPINAEVVRNTELAIRDSAWQPNISRTLRCIVDTAKVSPSDRGVTAAYRKATKSAT